MFFFSIYKSSFSERSEENTILSPSFFLEKIKFIPLFRKPIVFIYLRKIFFELRITSGIKEVRVANLGNFSRKFPFIPCYTRVSEAKGCKPSPLAFESVPSIIFKKGGVIFYSLCYYLF